MGNRVQTIQTKRSAAARGMLVVACVVLAGFFAMGDGRGSVRVNPGEHTIVNLKPTEMARVPAGWFIMGSGVPGVRTAIRLCNQALGPYRIRGFPGCGPHLFQDEMPRRSIYLKTFEIDRTEITRQQYMQCVAARVCRLSPDPPAVGSFRKPKAPVVLVNWSEAKVYCRWRRKRLPTEAEWEKAARGPFGKFWPWGNRWRTKLINHGGLHPVFRNFAGDRSDGHYWVAEVGSFFASRSFYGVEDMAGNVAEWVADRYAMRPFRPGSVRVNPKGPAMGSSRVVKGGSWYGPRFLTRSAARLSYPPNQRQTYIGFRCAR